METAPYLLFDGDCAAAMSFYRDCFGGELTITALADTPMKAAFPPALHDRIINAQLQRGAFRVSASDWMAADLTPARGNMSAVFVTGPADADLSEAFERLKSGASTRHLQELHEMPFGLYGQLYDRFGVQWIFRGEFT
ncbi:VOC family protein [Gryllotalpicola reticulitermitis]|uniref:VOC family protein n=1 Tax=Gryllotalpicola reticulitermitis TaxID=1184153 RepID=A0ABV8Q5E7_9MICO